MSHCDRHERGCTRCSRESWNILELIPGTWSWVRLILNTCSRFSLLHAVALNSVTFRWIWNDGYETCQSTARLVTSRLSIMNPEMKIGHVVTREHRGYRFWKLWDVMSPGNCVIRARFLRGIDLSALGFLQLSWDGNSTCAHFRLCLSTWPR